MRKYKVRFRTIDTNTMSPIEKVVTYEVQRASRNWMSKVKETEGITLPVTILSVEDITPKAQGKPNHDCITWVALTPDGKVEQGSVICPRKQGTASVMAEVRKEHPNAEAIGREKLDSSVDVEGGEV